MTKYAGEDLQLKWNATDISGVSRNLEIEEETKEIDVTAYGSADYEYITTKKRNRRASFMVLDDTGGSATEAALDAGNSGTLIYGPQGTAAGKPKKTVQAVILRNRKTYPHDDAVQFNVELRLSGAITGGTYP